MTPAERRRPDRPGDSDRREGADSARVASRAASSPAGPQSDAVPDIERYPNGGLKHTGFRLDGELHGPWQWYRTDGSLMRSGAFDRGRQVGQWRTFDRQGRLVKETPFGDRG